MGYKRNFSGKLLLSQALTIPQYREISKFTRQYSWKDPHYALDVQQGAPEYWCCWWVNDSGEWLEQNENEKTAYEKEWLEFLIKKFFQPWGITLSGTLKWTGDDVEDIGIILVEENEITVREGSHDVSGLFIYYVKNLGYTSDYDQYEDAVVIARSEKHARETWAKDGHLMADNLEATLIGTAKPDQEAGVVCESFHAG